MHRGLFRLKNRPDVPVVHCRWCVENRRYVAYLWTDDRTLMDKVARAPDDTAESYRSLDLSIRKFVTQWLLDRSERGLPGT